MRALAFLSLAAVAACAAPGAVTGDVLYYGFSQIDPDREAVVSNAWIGVRGDKIVETGASAPPFDRYEQSKEMAGLYAAPGLIDTHAHLTLGPVAIDMSGDTPALAIVYDDAITDHNARMLLAYGVTTIRNPGGDVEASVAYRHSVALKERIGPEAIIAGPVIERSPVAFHGLADLVSEQEPIEDIVERQAGAGVDAIKLYHGLTEDDVKSGVAAAHAHGLKTVGHLGISWKKAAEFGVDALVHMTPASADDLEPERRAAYLDSARPGAFAFFEWWEAAETEGEILREVVATLAENEVHLDLTLIAFRLAFWGDESAQRDRYLHLAHPAMADNWRSHFRFDLGWEAEDYARAKAVWPKIERFVLMLHEAGVPLTLGTDLANPFVAPGASLIQEMALHEAAGLPRWTILRMATSDAADILGLADKTGRIMPGLDADIVFLDRDPSKDFSAFHHARYVLADGRLLEAPALKESVSP